MILEALAVAIPSLAIGAGIMKLALKNKKVEMMIDRSEKKKYDTMNDPELLLKKLNKNGIMIDDGDEVSFAVEVKDGKKQLVQKIKKNAAPPGIPKVSKTTSNKTTKLQSEEKKGGEKSGKGKK